MLEVAWYLEAGAVVAGWGGGVGAVGSGVLGVLGWGMEGLGIEGRCGCQSLGGKGAGVGVLGLSDDGCGLVGWEM